MNSSKIKRRRRNKILKTLIAIFLLIVVAIAKEVNADDNSAEEPKTTHEQLGQSHYPLVELTTYRSKTEYLGAKQGYWATALHPVFNITHFLFDNILTNKPALPTGKIYSLRNCLYNTVWIRYYFKFIRLPLCPEWGYTDTRSQS